MHAVRRLTRNLGGLVAVSVLLLLVTFLPPDTSHREVMTNGVVRACVPTTYPPLVTGDPEQPGIDIEILRAVADDMGVRLLLSPNDAMGRDFNPRNWAINRGQCEVIAGGVVDSALTRSFLDTGPSYAVTGWAVIAPAPLDGIEGLDIGALTLISGLDRIGLASYLRGQDVAVKVVRSGEALVDGIAGGDLDGGVTEALLAGGLAAENDWWVALLPNELERYNLVFGLWKGDITLKREIGRAFRRLEADGTIAGIIERYVTVPTSQQDTSPEG